MKRTKKEEQEYAAWQSKVFEALAEGEKPGFGGFAFLSGAVHSKDCDNYDASVVAVRKAIEKGNGFITAQFPICCIPIMVAKGLRGLDQDEECVVSTKARSLELLTVVEILDNVDAAAKSRAVSRRIKACRRQLHKITKELNDR